LESMRFWRPPTILGRMSSWLFGFPSPFFSMDYAQIRGANGSLCLSTGEIGDNGEVWQEGKPRSR
jgi:hypothetical protein